MKTKRTAVFIAAILMLLSLIGCGEKYTESEVRAALDKLIPASAELNEIYFGEGLPIAGNEEEILALVAEADTDIEVIHYEPVSPYCKYLTEAELKDATYAVFSQEYADFLVQRGFSGISSSMVNSDGEMETTSAVYARYIETDGILTRRIGLGDEVIKLGRQYDLDGMVIARQNTGYVLVDIPTAVDGKSDVKVRLKLVMTDGGWRLDSPTY